MKKQLMTLVLALTTALSLSAKCDWSKVSLAYGNTCNVYKFEIAGTVDTCFKTTTIVTNKKTLKKDTFYTRAFGITFTDTGKYNVFVKVYNKCLGCDTGFEKLVYVTCKPTTKPKCDWSKVKPGYTGAYKSYKFEISSYDTCLSYVNILYHVGKADTIGRDRVFGVAFKDTGIYYVISRVHNKCTGCDTSYYIKIHSTNPPTTTPSCNWSKIGLYTSNKCRTVVFELGSRDTCITGYSLWAYNSATHKFDTLAHDRVFTRTLDTGWYTFKASFHNKCCNKDTFIYKEVHIGCDSSLVGTKLPIKTTTTGITIAPNPCDDKVIFSVASTSKTASNTYEVYDSKGKLVMTGKMGGSICVGTYNLPNGVYVVKIGTLMQKFIVKH